MTKQESKKAIIVFSLIALVFMIGSILTGGGAVKKKAFRP